MPLNARQLSQQSHIATSHCLDLDHFPPNRRFSVAPAADEDLPFLVAMTAQHIPGLKGTYQVVERVQKYSRSVLALRSNEKIVGCFAALFLNREGFAHLLNGGLSVADPSHSHLARSDETAAAIYIWAICCVSGMGAGATGNVMQWLRQDEFARADLYARPSTPKGKAFMIRSGFQPLAASEVNSLWIYRRTACIGENIWRTQ